MSRVTKVIRIYPQGTMNVSTKINDKPSNSCWDISVVDWPTAWSLEPCYKVFWMILPSCLWILMDKLKCCNTTDGSKMTDLLSSPPSELSRRLLWRWVCLYRSCTEVLERCWRPRGLPEEVWSSGWSWTNLFPHPHRYDSAVSSPELQDQKNITVNTQIQFSIV